MRKHRSAWVQCALLLGIPAYAMLPAGGQSSSSSSGQAPPSAAPSQTGQKQLDLNDRIVRYCRDKMGKKVGNGECYTLVSEAFASAGAEAQRKAFPSDGDYVWGTLVCKLECKNGRQELEIGEAGKSSDKRRRTDVKPGDVIQFRDVEFSGRYGQAIYHLFFAHHTAIVEQISDDGRACKIFQQNADGKQAVTEATLFLPDLAKGWLRVYRPTAKAPQG